MKFVYDPHESEWNQKSSLAWPFTRGMVGGNKKYLCTKMPHSLLSDINQAASSYSCLSSEQPIRFWLTRIKALIGVPNKWEDNSNVDMPTINQGSAFDVTLSLIWLIYLLRSK